MMDKEYLESQRQGLENLERPRLIITGKSPNILLCDIKEIELDWGEWSKKMTVEVVGENLEHKNSTKSAVIELARFKAIVQGVKGADLQQYINDNLCKANETTKTGGSDDIYIVYKQNLGNYRNPKFSKPKKKRVKAKKTHRKPKRKK